MSDQSVAIVGVIVAIMTAIITAFVSRSVNPPWQRYADEIKEDATLLRAQVVAIETRLRDGEKLLDTFRRELAIERARFTVALTYIHQLRAWIEQHCHSEGAPPDVPPQLGEHL